MGFVAAACGDDAPATTTTTTSTTPETVPPSNTSASGSGTTTPVTEEPPSKATGNTEVTPAGSGGTTGGTASGVTARTTSEEPVTTTTAAPAASALVKAPLVAPIAGAPNIDAKAYLVYDVKTNRVIASKAADTPLQIGSIQKLLSVAVALRAGALETVVTVPTLHLVAKASNVSLRKGDKYSRSVLIRAMLIASANDAAEALAVNIAGTEAKFAVRMNALAKQLGMTDTVAKGADGEDKPGQHSTANDVLAVARFVMRFPLVRAAVIRRSANIHGVHAATNLLLGTYAGADGIKTGHTAGAGWCVVASATRNGRQVYVVVLGAKTDAARFAGAKTLLTWAFKQSV